MKVEKMEWKWVASMADLSDKKSVGYLDSQWVV
jgi:hypothetical protein